MLILSGTNWHEGVIGIVAARLKDKFNDLTIEIVHGQLKPKVIEEIMIEYWKTVPKWVLIVLLKIP